jgi:hypothetical protein
MIQELTIDNLLNLGLTEEDAVKLYNSDEYNLQCNAGNFYTSKAENIFYTGFDYWRFIYLTKNLRFPFNTPELVREYFDLSLQIYLESKKEKLKTLYSEIFETQNFIKKETDFANENILYWQNKRLTISKHSLDVFQGYLYFLENYKPQNEPKKAIEFKDFFIKDFEENKIQKIKDEFKDLVAGKKIAHLIYLLQSELKLITLYSNDKKRARTHFIKALKENINTRTSGVDDFFESNCSTLKDTHFAKDSDYTTIKNQLGVIIGVQ